MHLVYLHPSTSQLHPARGTQFTNIVSPFGLGCSFFPIEEADLEGKAERHARWDPVDILVDINPLIDFSTKHASQLCSTDWYFPRSQQF